MEYVRMVTTSEHIYADHRLHVGDEFDCETIHVAFMEKLGRAKLKEGDAQGYETRHLEPRRRGRPRA